MAQMTAQPDTRHRANRTHPRVVELRWIRPIDFASASGMSRRGVYDHLAAGTLHGRRINGQWYIPIEELTAFFERNDQTAA